MTDNQLAKLDIHPDKSKLHPVRYWCNVTQTHMNIVRATTPEDIVRRIHAIGMDQGIEEGKEIRSLEFKNLINNVE